eukprot:CAMPEP_0177447064 /NCGR_PEP_ID=MMETSP0369-20130122/7424_1 /TAXON_ID=447022 ORGANISM="Scrippsiella hangoei-like, Strain SHHI-4" /NCGR_SAMPLE_ID=MMETSP0369 /ASSEMBLY_ACC=CAM_ASM_000364 /LENGTH=182 /DNA_ID=CAMNT_0018919343 /DNA_START=69 /DNA_END=617 /DNA_ORIENTATION=-
MCDVQLHPARYLGAEQMQNPESWGFALVQHEPQSFDLDMQLRCSAEPLTEFSALLRDPRLEVEGFSLEAVSLFKHGIATKVLKTRVSLQAKGREANTIVSAGGFDEVLHAVQACGYHVDAQHEARTFVAYGTWEPSAQPGLYKVVRRKDFKKQLNDPGRAHKAWLAEQNGRRRELERSWGVR